MTKKCQRCGSPQGEIREIAFMGFAEELDALGINYEESTFSFSGKPIIQGVIICEKCRAYFCKMLEFWYKGTKVKDIPIVEIDKLHALLNNEHVDCDDRIEIAVEILDLWKG